MKKLELEYDYDTDEDQILAARSLLMQENFGAIKYCVELDPLLLVGNLNSDWEEDWEEIVKRNFY